jgi:hypothetical protein
MFKDTPEGATSFCEACEETANHILTKKNHTCGRKLKWEFRDFTKLKNEAIKRHS